MFSVLNSLMATFLESVDFMTMLMMLNLITVFYVVVYVDEL